MIYDHFELTKNNSFLKKNESIREFLQFEELEKQNIFKLKTLRCLYKILLKYKIINFFLKFYV